MKKLLFFALFLTFFSCEEVEDITPTPTTKPVIHVPNGLWNFPLSAPNVVPTRILPLGDPNLDPNWNWERSNWEPWDKAYGTISQRFTGNPFFTDEIFGHADVTKVIKKADGWILVARDFGTSTAAPPYPWIMIYNKYRGIMRVCVLRARLLQTSFQTMELSFDSTEPTPDLFKFTGETTQTAITRKGIGEWMVGEFNLQGYDDLFNQNARFRIDLTETARYEINSDVDINLSSTVKLDSTVQIFSNLDVYLRKDAANQNKYKALDDIKWGVMNYSRPAIIQVRYICQGDSRDDCEYQYHADAGFVEDVVSFNPAIEGDIATKEAGIIYTIGNEVTFYPISTLSYFSAGQPENYPEAIGVRITYI